MNDLPDNLHKPLDETALTTELLVLPDGRILVHNLTPAFADLLRLLSPSDQDLALRSTDKLPPTLAANSPDT